MEKCLIFVPHQDDETNIAGNVLGRLNESYEVFIVYSSIDCDSKIARIRKKEAIAACDVWGINQSHIIFLNYPDTPNRKGKHFYSDIKNRKIVCDIEELIMLYMPELIIGVDFDSHSDHRMISLAVDEAIGKVIKWQYQNRGYEKSYIPTVLKGFAYETAYYGPKDYCASNLGDTDIKTKNLANPSFEWERRISIKSDEKVQLIWRRKAYKALKCHHSQYAILHADSVINADNVFWQKRTDNLLFNNNVKVITSSGNAKKLTDFMVLDTKDIITENPREIDYSYANWKPSDDDNLPSVFVSFGELTDVDHLVLHGSLNDEEDRMIHGAVYINNELITIVNQIRAYGRATYVKIGRKNVRSIRILFSPDDNIELCELEIFNNKNQFGEVEVKGLLNRKSTTQEVNRFAAICINTVNDLGFGLARLTNRLTRKLSNICKRKKWDV